MIVDYKTALKIDVLIKKTNFGAEEEEEIKRLLGATSADPRSTVVDGLMDEKIGDYNQYKGTDIGKRMLNVVAWAREME